MLSYLQFLASPRLKWVLGVAVMLLGALWALGASWLTLSELWTGRGLEVRFRDYDFQRGVVFIATTAIGGIVMLLGYGIILGRFRGVTAFASFLGIAAAFVAGRTSTLPPLLALSLFLFFLLTFIHLVMPVKRPALNAAGPVVRPDPLTDANWRDWLLASLRDTGIPPRGDRFWVAVRSFAVVAAIIIGGRLVGYIPFGSRGSAIAFIIGWYIFALIVLLPMFIRAARQGAQARARDAEEELLKAGSRRPILYLRSFNFDEIAARTKPTLWEYVVQRPLATPEQELTGVLRKCGPVIAIGRPDEKLPALGAARFYVAHEKWQEKVSDIVRVCQLVVLTSGVTEGLRWEIEHLVKELPPERLILWCHPHLMKLSEQERETEWKHFVDMLGGVFRHPLPDKLGDTRFFHFDADFRPIAVAPTGRLGKTRSALRALLAAKGLPKPAPVMEAERWRRWRLATAIVLGWIAVTGTAYATAAWIGKRTVLARNDLSAFNRLASDFYSAEQFRRAKVDDILAALRRLAARSEYDWLVAGAISKTAVDKLRPTLDRYIAMFETVVANPPLDQTMYGRGQPLFAGGRSALEAQYRTIRAKEITDHLVRYLGELDAYMAQRIAGVDYSWVSSMQPVIKARIEMFSAEVALTQFVLDNTAARGVPGTDRNGEVTLTYRDRALQTKANDLLARRRDAARVLQQQVSRF